MRSSLPLLFLIPAIVHGYPSYLKLLPNTYDDCLGVGHESCGPGGGTLTPFGHDFTENGRSWPQICALDSDGDGKSNGDELGDPCCLWDPGAELPEGVLVKADLSHPGDKESRTGRPSAIFEAPVVAGAEVSAAAGKRQLAFEVLVASNSWPCQRDMNLRLTTADGAHRDLSLVFPVGAQRFVLNETLLGGPLGDVAEVEVRALSASNLHSRVGSCPGGGCEPLATFQLSSIQDASVDALAASSNATLFAPREPPELPYIPDPTTMMIIYACSIVVAGLMALACPMLCHSNALRHKVCLLPQCAACNNKVVNAWRLSPNNLLMLVWIFAALAFVFFSYLARNILIGLEPSQIVSKPLARMAVLGLFLVFTLASRNCSPAVWLLRFSPNKQIIFHTIFGWFVVLCSVVHGSIELYKYGIPIIGYNAFFLCGFLAWFCMIIGGLVTLIRSRYYAIFKKVHFVLVLVPPLLCYHVYTSDFPTGSLWLLLGFGIWFLDMLYTAGKTFCPQAKIEHAAVLDGAFVHLRIHKPGFRWTVGQWASITLPGLSKTSHPFSMVPCDEPEASGPEVRDRFELIIGINERPDSRADTADTTTVVTPMIGRQAMQAARRASTWTAGLAALVRSGAHPSEVFVSGPYGNNFKEIVKRKPQRVLLVAAGTGITPIASLCRAQYPGIEIHLLYAFRATQIYRAVAHLIRKVPMERRMCYLTRGALPTAATGMEGVQCGRPDVLKWIEEQAASCQAAGVTSVACFVCASDLMLSQACEATRYFTELGIEYEVHNEPFRF